MKKHLSAGGLCLWMLVCGVAGLNLRVFLYRLGVDERGLLDPSALLMGLLILVIGAAAVGIFLRPRSISSHDVFGPSPAGGIGAFAAALGILLLWTRIPVTGGLAVCWKVLSILGALGLAFSGFCRIRGLRPGFAAHGLSCLFFAVHLIVTYRICGNDPQLSDYLFQILACIALMLTAYQHTAWDVGLGKGTGLTVCAAAGAFLCLLAAYGPYPVFYLTCGSWCLLELLPGNRRPEAGTVPETEG